MQYISVLSLHEAQRFGEVRAEASNLLCIPRDKELGVPGKCEAFFGAEYRRFVS